VDPQKETSVATEQDPLAREAFRQAVGEIPFDQLVFVDETSTNVAMSRRYARAPRGKRAYGKVPRNYGKPTSLVGALAHDGLGAAMTVVGAIDTKAFALYIRDLLCPSLKPGQVVVLDNLSVHKALVVREHIEAVGCGLWFLPSYSPDLSPIELAFSKLKEALRKAAARTQATLDEAISKALELVTAEDALGWFRHCGYHPISPT
jgi:transposase